MTDFDRPDHDPTTDSADTPTPTAATPIAHDRGAGRRRRRSSRRPATDARDRAASAGSRPASSSRSSSASTAVATLVLTGASAHVDGRSATCRPTASPTASSGSTCPATSARRSASSCRKFPGFADQAALDTKLDEVLDRLVSEGTDGKQTFTKRHQAVVRRPARVRDRAAPDGAAAIRGRRRRDARAPAPAVDQGRGAGPRLVHGRRSAETGVTGTTETYNGTELTVFTDAEVAASPGRVRHRRRQGRDRRRRRVGQGRDRHQGLERPRRRATPSRPRRPRSTGDDIGFMFVDIKALLDAAPELDRVGRIGAADQRRDARRSSPTGPPSASASRATPSCIDSVTPHVDGRPDPTENRANGVAAFAPPSTIALVAGNDVGATLHEIDRRCYRERPGARRGLRRRSTRRPGSSVASTRCVGWMGDTGVVVAAERRLRRGRPRRRSRPMPRAASSC